MRNDQQACLPVNALKDDEDTASFLIRRLNRFNPIVEDNAEKCSCSFDFEIEDDIARFENIKHYNNFMYNLLLCPITLTSSNTDSVRAEFLRQVEGIKTLIPWRTEQDAIDDYFKNHVEDMWHRLHQGKLEDITKISEDIRNIWTQHKRNVHNIIFYKLRVKRILIVDIISFYPNNTVYFEVSSRP